MKMIIVALALVAFVAANPVQIVYSEFEKQPDGSYLFRYETEDGIKRTENGELKQAVDEENNPHPVVVVRGSYSYPNDHGEPETINYFADETGYHAEGPSVPKAA